MFEEMEVNSNCYFFRLFMNGKSVVKIWISFAQEAEVQAHKYGELHY